jgi:ribosome-binding factor A
LLEEIRQEIDVMLAGELKDPRLDLSIHATEVRLSPDQRQVKVFVDVRGDPEEQAAALEALEAAAGFIRRQLTERLQLRRSPRPEFVLDHSAEYGARIDQLLRGEKKPPDS